MTREEAIKRFNGIIHSMSISVAQSKFYPSKAELDELCDMAIEALSADAEQGEWIEREDWNGDYYYDCSVCGESFVLCDGTPSMNLYHFCPNCGAKMKGGDTE